jgi:NAD(P)-dependent dehydrogenase (short-subunit alcohol dehydrogenase family)
MSRIAVITGANQGLGFALAEGLAHRLGPDDVVYLTGRNAFRVARATARVAGARAEVRAHVLDVRDAAAVDAFADELQAAHGGIDIVFSNHYQRVMPEDRPRDVIARYVNTNNLGTTRILRAFAPLLRPGGRLFVVASSLGALTHLPPELHDRFDTDAMTFDDVDLAILDWQDAVVEERAGREGWPDFINIPSKVGQVAAVRVLARERAEADARQNILIAAVCPGMIDTPASRPWFDMSGAQTPAQAAVALLRLALDPEVDPRFYGELVRFREVVPWVDTVRPDARVVER